MSLIVIAGVLSYGMYLRGGDPAALWTSLADRGLGQLDKLLTGLKNDTSRAAAAISNGTASLTGERPATALTEFYTWQDAEGVRHFSTSAPEGRAAAQIYVDPNVNVLAPVTAQNPPSSAEADADVKNELGGALPGVAGQVLATRQPAGRSAGDAVPGMDPAQLLRMLQSAEN